MISSWTNTADNSSCRSRCMPTCNYMKAAKSEFVLASCCMTCPCCWARKTDLRQKPKTWFISYINSLNITAFISYTELLKVSQDPTSSTYREFLYRKYLPRLDSSRLLPLAGITLTSSQRRKRCLKIQKIHCRTKLRSNFFWILYW